MSSDSIVPCNNFAAPCTSFFYSNSTPNNDNCHHYHYYYNFKPQTTQDPECNIGRFRGQINDLPVDIQDSIKDVLLEDAVDVDDEFEKALAALCLDKVYKGADDTQGCSSSAQTFVEGENQELDSREQTISKKVTQAVNDLIIDHTSNQPTVEGKKKSSDVSDDRGEESFDGEFGAALLDALSSNPNFCP